MSQARMRSAPSQPQGRRSPLDTGSTRLARRRWLPQKIVRPDTAAVRSRLTDSMSRDDTGRNAQHRMNSDRSRRCTPSAGFRHRGTRSQANTGSKWPLRVEADWAVAEAAGAVEKVAWAEMGAAGAKEVRAAREAAREEGKRSQKRGLKPRGSSGSLQHHAGTASGDHCSVSRTSPRTRPDCSSAQPGGRTTQGDRVRANW